MNGINDLCRDDKYFNCFDKVDVLAHLVVS
jgi:hypothetical protein